MCMPGMWHANNKIRRPEGGRPGRHAGMPACLSMHAKSCNNNKLASPQAHNKQNKTKSGNLKLKKNRD